MKSIKIDKKSKTSIKTQIEQNISDKIINGDWEPGMKIPSERMLSETLQVSRKTVRNAILSLMDKEMVERSTGQGTYVRKRMPFHFDSDRKTGNIGYVLCKSIEKREDISREPFYFEVLTCLRNDLATEKYHLLFSFLDEEDEQECKGFQSFLDKVDGLVIYEASRPAFLNDLKSSGIPMLLLQPDEDTEQFDCISFDIEQGARLGVDYLLDLGFRNIAMINGPVKYKTARLRSAGYESAMKGIGLSSPSIVEASGWRKDAGYLAMNTLLNEHTALEAVFCANDALATGAVAAAFESGLKIPGDVSILGFDNSILAEHCHPPLSSVKLNVQQMAEHAAHRIVKMISKPNLLPLSVKFPAELELRESCRNREKAKLQ